MKENAVVFSDVNSFKDSENYCVFKSEYNFSMQVLSDKTAISQPRCLFILVTDSNVAIPTVIPRFVLCITIDQECIT